jgi:hypothetical protein
MLFWGFTEIRAWNPIPTDTARPADSLAKKVKIKPKIRLGLDISRLFLSARSKDYQGSEGSIDFNVGRKIFGVNLGFLNRSIDLPRYDAFQSGVYGSVGFCRNVFDESDNILAYGGRLAGSSFSYQSRNVAFSNPFLNENQFLDLENRNGQVLWLEFVSTMRAKVIGWLMMGFELRVKGRFYSKLENENPYFVPGFGLYSNGLNLGFNYFVYINLPTKK